MAIRHMRVLVVVAVVAAACDLSTQPDTGGVFDANVSGGVSAELEGAAIFYSSHNGEFSLAMTDPTDHQAIAVASLEGRPGTGTFEIEHHDSETGLIAAYAREGEPVARFSSVTGEIEITTSTSSRLEGEVTFEAVGTVADDPDREVSITVVASFDARCVPTGGSPCT